MSETKNYVTPEHFSWLVERRSKNQKTTLDLYTIIYKYEKKLNRSPEFYDIAQNLTGIAFSLWRSVFLSDVTDDVEKNFTDLNKFMISLISDNTVLYQTDKNSRNWSFGYYLDNAEFRLKRLATGYPHIAKLVLLNRISASEKERWDNAQEALEDAISAFEGAINAPFSYSK